MLLLLFAVSVAAFALMTASPIDPLKANVGQAALGSMSQEQIAKLEEYWGVGQPPLQRYIAWFRDFVRGDTEKPSNEQMKAFQEMIQKNTSLHCQIGG